LSTVSKAGEPGFEPRLTDPESVVLPLHYSPIKNLNATGHLNLHPTGQYCKKIRGRLFYFGKNKQLALKKYLESATKLHTSTKNSNNVTNEYICLKDLCNLYLDYQHDKTKAETLTKRYYADQIKSLQHFVKFIGPHKNVCDIRTIDLQVYKNNLMKKYHSAASVNLGIAIMKAMFNWAFKNDLVDKIPKINVVNKLKTARVERLVFTPEQIHNLLDVSVGDMKTMILLGLNCGFGSTDCALLSWSDIDWQNERVKLPRSKTGIYRNLKLWPETINALKALPKRGTKVFYTNKGNLWVRIIETHDDNGVVKYSRVDSVSTEFSKLLKKAGIKTEKGVGFYTLRRTAATMAARSGDPFAVQKLLGHADLKMATVYVQDVSEQTDRVINNMRKLIIQDGSLPAADSSADLTGRVSPEGT